MRTKVTHFHECLTSRAVCVGVLGLLLGFAVNRTNEGMCMKFVKSEGTFMGRMTTHVRSCTRGGSEPAGGAT